MPLQQLSSLYPQILLSFGIIVIILSGIKQRNPESMKKQIALLSLIFLILGAILCLTAESNDMLTDLFRLDGFARFFLLFAVCAAGLTVVLSSQSREIPGQRFTEFVVLLLIMVIGISLMAAAVELVAAYLAIEMVSLSAYVLTGFKKTHRGSHEAALKYVIYGSIASGIMIFGMSLLYGIAGSTSFSGIALILADSGSFIKGGTINVLAVIIALIMVFTGIFFKIAVVPFHMWCPDVYQGAPTPFTGFLSVAPKAAGFALLIRFVSILLPQADQELRISLLAIFGLVSAVTMTLGNFSAIHQMNIKRLLAYSSIAHAGYVLMGLTVLDKTGFEAVLLYLAVYLFMNLGAFAVVQMVVDTMGHEDLAAFKGLGYQMPFAALALAVFLFSLAGLPPLAGFIGKFYIFAALIKEGGFWYILLALIGILNSVLALFYYVRILREMYLRGMEIENPLRLTRFNTGVLVVMALIIILLGLYWEPLRIFVQDAVSTIPIL
jgi:NADH-quinone oxidoreductase subunit N